MSVNLLTQKEAAEELGVFHHTIHDLAKAWERKPKPVPRCGKAKGFDDEDMAVFRQALNMPEPAASAT